MKKNSLTALVILALVTVQLLFAGSIAKAASPTSDPAIPRTYFGMHFHRADAGTPWPSFPIGTWRLWDCFVAWPNLEPERGKWDFKRLDRYVAMAKLSGTTLLLPLGLSPRWASARPTEASGYQPGNAAEPKDIEDWRRYVRTVAERYKGKIRDYEMWNEVNYPRFYSGSIDRMVLLTRETQQILKEVDPDNRLVSPSVVGAVRPEDPHFLWLDEFLKKGGGAYVDIVGYHFYVPTGAPEMMLPLIKRVQELMTKHGIREKPLWNTETGWLIQNKEQPLAPGTYPANWKVLDQDQAAAYLARSLILGWYAGVSRYYWYAWDNKQMGLIEPESKSMKPEATAFAVTMRWLEGAKMKGCSTSDEVWVCSMTGGKGDDYSIAWSAATSKKRIRFSGGNPKEMEFIDGTRQPIRADGSEGISIGGAPVRFIP